MTLRPARSALAVLLVLLGREVRAVPVADYEEEPWLRAPDDDGMCPY